MTGRPYRRSLPRELDKPLEDALDATAGLDLTDPEQRAQARRILRDGQHARRRAHKRYRLLAPPPPRRDGS